MAHGSDQGDEAAGLNEAQAFLKTSEPEYFFDGLHRHEGDTPEVNDSLIRHGRMMKKLAQRYSFVL